MTPTPFGQRLALDAKRLDPYGINHSERVYHDWCWELYVAMPWMDFTLNWHQAARSAFVFALSVCQMPKPPGSLGALLDRAFPAGSLPSEEATLFEELSKASLALRCSRFDFEDGSGARACELAPLFFGGLKWLEDPMLASASRLTFAQSMADSCANRIFFDARAWNPPPRTGMEAFAHALDLCAKQTWTPSETMHIISNQTLGGGDTSQWAATQAARMKIALSERSDIFTACQAVPSDTTEDGHAGRRL